MSKNGRSGGSRRFRENAMLALMAALTGAAVFVLNHLKGRSACDRSKTAAWREYEVVNVYPHDPSAFTQGLIYRDGHLFESTGLTGRSSLRKVRLETGEIVMRREVDRRFFCEGLTDWSDRLIQLTWKSGMGFIYDAESLDFKHTFRYEGEGWGLTRDKNRLIMSDGTAALRALDPLTLTETGRLVVKDGGVPVGMLNELEMVGDEIFANVWQTDAVVIISPMSGKVTGRMDLGPLRLQCGPDADVPNGIAYDPDGGRLFVTGKFWPKLFEIRLKRGP